MNRIAVIMPVFRRVAAARNAVACFLHQTLPADWAARLFVIDDGDTFVSIKTASTPTHGVSLWRTPQRFPSLPAKYNRALAAILDDYQPDLAALFDDDDVYLPWHLGVHIEALRGKRRAWSKPSLVLSDYSGTPRQEVAAGRFHGSIAFTADITTRWDETAGPDFDQRFMAALGAECGPAVDPLEICPNPSYLFRWHTGSYHGQWWMSEGGNVWYDRVAEHVPDPPRAELAAEFDEFTRSFMQQRGSHDCR